jgi:Protein of unknown function (DUF3732)
MKFAIKSVILWPRRGDFAPRVVPFEPGAVNVISGRSRTGKSAIIPIIDYCLGSDRCTIPVTTIRDACVWFGVLAETSQGQKLYARREPGAQRTTNEMYVIEGAQVEIPHRIPEKNATTEVVRAQLDDLAGLTSLDFDAEATGSGFRGRPSFRDLMAFVFQPQNVVANPNILFYKADSYEHREKLRSIFPYVLGAITPQVLAKQHELEELRRTLRRKKLELENVRQVSARFIAQLQSHLDRVKELGLLEADEIMGFDQQIGLQLLRKVISRSKDQISVSTSAATISGSADEMVLLRQQESEQAVQLAQMRQRFFEMTELRKNSVDYKAALYLQRDRLAISAWLRGQAESDHDCPVCGNQMHRQEEKLEALLRSLEEIENSATQFQTAPASFDREYQRVRSGMNQMADQLAATQLRLRTLRQMSDEERKRQYTELSASRYIGRLESELRVLESVGQDGDLQADVNVLERRVRELEKEVDSRALRERLSRALSNVSGIAARLLPELDAERPYDAIELSINDLTIKVKSTDREDYLWEIGSGSNWLSYHLAISLSLQLFFASLPESPVPQMLVYDQPSQVYFPRRLVEREGDPEDPAFKDEDVEAVRKVFKVLSSAVEESGHSLQVIVLDHAPETVWAGIPNMNYVDEWRGGRALVPLDWQKTS